MTVYSAEFHAGDYPLPYSPFPEAHSESASLLNTVTSGTPDVPAFSQTGLQAVNEEAFTGTTNMDGGSPCTQESPRELSSIETPFPQSCSADLRGYLGNRTFQNSYGNPVVQSQLRVTGPEQCKKKENVLSAPTG